MFFASVLAVAVVKRSSTILPDYTPGCLCTTSDAHFSENAYPEGIPKCTRSVSTAEKTRVAKPYGVAKSDWPNYEFDHFIPLGIGGSNDDDNLWPQPEAGGSLDKDKVENQAYQQLSKGQITQRQAVKMILDWTNNAYGTNYNVDQVMERECTGQNH
ncbi:hypothetical protein EDD86DRAFT_204210 [Gorgonomyces haynaldii]|nr:hypothetical protein EDD86DRAFT_204210 [Gorgonomyces haynaldii]